MYTLEHSFKILKYLLLFFGFDEILSSCIYFLQERENYDFRF